jgi:hypothetical protein
MRRIHISHRSPADTLGRFGGGWQWALGVQASRLRSRRGTILIRLLVLTVHVNWGRRIEYTMYDHVELPTPPSPIAGYVDGNWSGLR